MYLAENFDDVASFKKKWIKSEAKKQGVDEDIAKYDGKWEVIKLKHYLLNYKICVESKFYLYLFYRFKI